jgi:hypothetical protein
VRGGYCSGYHPDFLAIDSDGVHWVIEAKSHRDLESEDVQAKREAGQRWANHVSADEKAPPRGAISLVSEDDVKIAKGDGGTQESREFLTCADTHRLARWRASFYLAVMLDEAAPMGRGHRGIDHQENFNASRPARFLFCAAARWGARLRQRA